MSRLEIENKLDAFTIRKPKQIVTREDAIKEMKGLNDDFWRISKLKMMGWGYEKIKKEYNNQYSMEEISYIIEKIVNINTFLSLQDGDALRTQMVMELNNQKAMLYNSATINSATGETELSDKQHRTLLGINDRLIQLQGLAAPIKTETTSNVTVTINDAKSVIEEKLSRFKASIDKSKIIDVTPIPQEQESEVSDA